MKYKFLLFATLVLFVVLPIPPLGKRGAYNTISEMIWCNNQSACIHEVGHKLDDEADWISHSNEFSLAVSAFVWHEIAEHEITHPYVYKIMKFPGIFSYAPPWTDPNAELYASIFQWSEGKKENMPEIFRRFYDWERAQELIDEIKR